MAATTATKTSVDASSAAPCSYRRGKPSPIPLPPPLPPLLHVTIHPRARLGSSHTMLHNCPHTRCIRSLRARYIRALAPSRSTPHHCTASERRGRRCCDV